MQTHGKTGPGVRGTGRADHSWIPQIDYSPPHAAAVALRFGNREQDEHQHAARRGETRRDAFHCRTATDRTTQASEIGTMFVGDNKDYSVPITSPIAEPEVSTPLIPKHAIRHDPEPVACTSRPHNLFP
jgi:hypothetical protein